MRTTSFSTWSAVQVETANPHRFGCSLSAHSRTTFHVGDRNFNFVNWPDLQRRSQLDLCWITVWQRNSSPENSPTSRSPTQQVWMYPNTRDRRRMHITAHSAPFCGGTRCPKTRMARAVTRAIDSYGWMMNCLRRIIHHYCLHHYCLQRPAEDSCCGAIRSALAWFSTKHVTGCRCGGAACRP